MARGSVVPLKANVDEALADIDLVDHVLVLRRCHNDIGWKEDRDVWWHDVVPQASSDCACVPMEAEACHSFCCTRQARRENPRDFAHHRRVHGLDRPHREKHVQSSCRRQPDVLVHRRLRLDHRAFVHRLRHHAEPSSDPHVRSAANAPAEDRFWDICARHSVTHFYTAPTAIRAFMKWGEEHPNRHDLSSLQVLGTVGEPINPEAWMWYHRVIGHERCPIVDTWWQTETGGHMITPLPCATPTVPGSCTLPAIGVDAAIVDQDGQGGPHGTGGLLAIRKPWPGMLRGIYGDRERLLTPTGHDCQGCISLGMAPGVTSVVTSGSWAAWMMSSMFRATAWAPWKLKAALVSHPAVVEAAVVGMPHEIKGTGIAAFCTLSPTYRPQNEQDREALIADLRKHVGGEIGAIAKPDLLRFTDALPKTKWQNHAAFAARRGGWS